MGWLSMTRDHMGGHSSPKSYLDAQCTFPPDPDKGRETGLRVIKSVWRACVYYAAAQIYGDHINAPQINGADGDRAIIAIVCLVRWNPRARDGYIFAYKDMDENMGPCESDCPASVLNLLTPTAHPHALEWRTRCRATLALTARQPPPDGAQIRFADEISFADGHVGKTFRVFRRKAQVLLRSEAGSLYRVPGMMKLAWTLETPPPIQAPRWARRSSDAGPPAPL